MSALQVIAFRACKDDPSHPDNNIAFTLDGHLCFVVVPEAAHAIVKRAAGIAGNYTKEDYSICTLNDMTREWKLNTVGRILAARRDIAAIAKKA